MEPIGTRIAHKIQAGTLPTAEPRKVWAGYGLGGLCSGCDEPILHAQTEYEFEDPRGDGSVRFHAGCYGLWEAACHRLGHRRPESDEPS